MKTENARGSVPLRGGIVCLAVGLAVMFIPLPTFVVYLPLFLAAFVLAIVAIAQGRAAGGVTLVLLTVTAPGGAWLAAMALGFTMSGAGIPGAAGPAAAALKEPKAKAQNHEPVEKQVAPAVEKQATNVVEPAAPIAPPPAPSRFVGREVGRMKEAFEMVGGNDESALFRSKDYGLAVLLYRGLVAGVGVKRLDKNAITKEEAAQILATVEGGSWNAAPGVSLQDRWTNGNGLSAELQLAGRMLGITRPDLVDQAERERKSERVASVEAGTNRPERLTGTDTPEAARTRQGAVAAKTAIEERRARAAAAREVRLVAFQLQEATNGSPGAQFAVGLRYLRGEGVEANAELARAWLEKSAAQGNDLAKAKIAELVGK